MSVALGRGGHAGEDSFGVMAQESNGCHGMVGVGERRYRGRGEQRLEQRGTFATSRKENQHGTPRATGQVGVEGGRPCWMPGALTPPSSLSG